MIRAVTIALVLLSFALPGAAGKKPETLDELKARAEATKGEHQPLLYAEVVQREVEVADQLFTDGDVEKGHAMVKECVAYAEKARNATLSIPPRKMKDVEIALRKAENRLNAVRRTLALEDQQDVQNAADKIGQIRNDILDRMFAPKRK